MKNVKILETTLRDGSYAVNFSFTSADTAAICKELEEVGFEFIEIGHGVGLNASNTGHGQAAQTDEEYMIAAKNSLKKPGFKITPEVVKSNLWTKDLPPVDLVIRTGGEPHWSVGCMMWDIAETQFAFSDTFWPDFTPEEFKAVLKRYSGTERRLGR